MMHRAWRFVVLFLILPLAIARGQAADEPLRRATAWIDLRAMEADLVRAGLPPADVSLVKKTLESIAKRSVGAANGLLGPLSGAQERESAAALAAALYEDGVPERLIHPVVWTIQDRRFPRVDPGPLFEQLREYTLDPTEIRKLTDSKVRVYAKERTDVAEAQYEHITNSLYLPPDYLEPGASPPRLKRSLSRAELNTVIHELDHAEKDQLHDFSEPYGKSLGSSMMAGIRKFGLWGAGGGLAALGLSAIPKLALLMPKVALALVVGSVVVGAGYGAYQYFFGDRRNSRDARQQRAKDAVDDIAKVIRSDRDQRVHPAIPLTESQSKAWEVSGYFMGDSIQDVVDQIDAIKLHNHRRIRQAKTKAEVEAILRAPELPPSLAARRFGTPEVSGSAFFRVKEINFPYKQHPELLRQLYDNSLGLKPPADARELIGRIHANPSSFPELRTYLEGHARRRIQELEQAGQQPPPASVAPPDRTVPNFEDLPAPR
jgi:hypothetical protein